MNRYIEKCPKDGKCDIQRSVAGDVVQLNCTTHGNGTSYRLGEKNKPQDDKLQAEIKDRSDKAEAKRKAEKDQAAAEARKATASRRDHEKKAAEREVEQQEQEPPENQ